MSANYPKYNSYRNAHEQIDKAIEASFYLEAITIEESILCDRLLRFYNDQRAGGDKKKDLMRITLGTEVAFLEKSAELRNNYSINFLNELSRFWESRNKCLHQIAKSEPGMPTENFEDLINLAKETAVSGKELVKMVSKWAMKYKKTVMTSSG